MVRETRHLWVGNLPDNVREERIREHFQRYINLRHVLSTSFFICVYRAAIDEAPLPFFLFSHSLVILVFFPPHHFPLDSPLAGERPLLCPPPPSVLFSTGFYRRFLFWWVARGPTNARHTHTGTWQRQTIVFVSSSSFFFFFSLSGRLSRELSSFSFLRSSNSCDALENKKSEKMV